MTRKDYIVIADAPKRSRPAEIGQPGRRSAAATQWLRDVGSLARTLQADNSRFDQARFIDACMLED